MFVYRECQLFKKNYWMSWIAWPFINNFWVVFVDRQIKVLSHCKTLNVLQFLACQSIRLKRRQASEIGWLILVGCLSPFFVAWCEFVLSDFEITFIFWFWSWWQTRLPPKTTQFVENWQRSNECRQQQDLLVFELVELTSDILADSLYMNATFL